MKNQKGFVLFPVLVIIAMFSGIILMTAPTSVKKDVAQHVGLEKK